jgi:hypothetical protein
MDCALKCLFIAAERDAYKKSTHSECYQFLHNHTFDDAREYTAEYCLPASEAVLFLIFINKHVPLPNSSMTF